MLLPPFALAHPTWEDDPRFDIDDHIEEVTVPAPGDDRAMAEAGGRAYAGMLDREHPLWKLCLLQGRADGNTAMVWKIHHAMIDGVSGVQLITHGAGMPTAGARTALAEQARKFSDGTVAVAVVIEQAGFFGSAMRSAVTGIQMLAKAAFPIKVFRSVQEVAAWLPGPHAERTGTVLDPARLEAVLETVRDPLFSKKARGLSR